MLDLRTIAFSYSVTSFFCAIVIILLWRQNRTRYKGTDYWVADAVLQFGAALLLSMRDSIPNAVSIALPVIFVLVGTLLAYQGVLRFLDRRVSQTHNIVIVAVAAGIHLWFSFGQPSLAVRNLNFSVAMLIICAQTAWALWDRQVRQKRQTNGLGIVYAMFCVINIVRIAEFIFGHHVSDDYMKSGTFHAVVLAGYQFLYILLSYFLVLMYNERLLSEIREQEALFSAAFRMAPHSATLTRISDGRIVMVNSAFRETTGYDESDVVGTTTIDLGLWRDPEARNALTSELSESGLVSNAEAVFIGKDGHEIHGLFSSALIRVHDEMLVLTLINDITEKVKAREADEKFKEALVARQRLESVGRLARGVAHDVNNPLSVIINCADIIAADAKPASVTARMADDIIRNGERIAGITRNLLAFSRGEKELPEPADAAELINSALTMIGGDFERDGISVRSSIPDGLPMIMCRKRQIELVILNILTNARDALNDRYPGRHPEKQVVIGARFDDDTSSVVIAIANHGDPVPESIRDRIFEPFFTTKPRGIGTGLGLSTSHGIITDHGGTISVESGETAPTRFDIRIPVQNQRPGSADELTAVPS